METISSSEPLDLSSIRSGIRELEEIHSNCNEGFASGISPDSNQLVTECALQLESKVQQIVSECSDFSFLGIEDLDTFVEHLKEELNKAEAESAKISSEIEILTRNHVEDSIQLESDIELLNHSLMDFASSQDMDKGKGHAFGDDLSYSKNTLRDYDFESLKLDYQIEESKIILKTLQEFDSTFKRLDTIEQLEDALSGLKVIDFDGTFIRLSLQTYLPKLEELSCPQKIEDAAEPSDVNHEFLIEIANETMEVKNIEMFPNDVFITDIVDAAKSLRQLVSHALLGETMSSLEWFVRKVQDRIIQFTSRQLVVNNANKSRHSLEYLDRDEMVVAHLVGGIDAFIMLSQAWPLSKSPLKLMSLKSSDHSKEISLSFLSKVEEAVNSMDIQMRFDLLSFVDAIEKLLVEQMRL